MGLFRVIAIALILWLIARMFNNYQVKKSKQQQQKQESASKESQLSREKMVQCQYCAIHLPKSDAVNHNTYWFCTPQHQSLFLKK